MSKKSVFKGTVIPIIVFEPKIAFSCKKTLIYKADHPHKRIIEDAKETFRGDKKLRKIEMKKLEIAEQEKAISKKQAEAKLLVNQANTLMEETESMRTFLNKERNILEKAEKQIQTSIIKSSCQKAFFQLMITIMKLK